MDAKIQPTASAVELPAPFQLTGTGLLIEGDISYEEWESAGKSLQRVARAWQWWVGDWLAYGEQRYGETYTQAIEETGYAYQTLANTVFVAKGVDFSRRRETLSFAHHAEVAKLPPDAQDRLLTLAEYNAWTRDELREQVRQATSGKIKPPASPALDPERPSDETGTLSEPEPRDELAAANRQIEELANELTSASAEIDELSRIVDSMEADDKAREIATWVRKYGQLEGRLNQVQRTLTEATKQAKWRGKLLKEVRDVLGVERDRDIIPRLMELTGVRAAS